MEGLKKKQKVKTSIFSSTEVLKKKKVKTGNFVGYFIHRQLVAGGGNMGVILDIGNSRGGNPNCRLACLGLFGEQHRGIELGQV